MKKILYIAILSIFLNIFLTGCTSKGKNESTPSGNVNLGEEQKEKKENIKKITEKGVVNFIEKSGKVNVSISKNAIDTEVIVENLDNSKEYNILLDNEDGGVLFSTESNAKIIVGEKITDTNYKPDSLGNLQVTMKNPLRIVTGVKKIRIIVKSASMEGAELINSEYFTID